MNHFFVPSEAITGSSVCLTAAQSHQVCHVLRMKAGEAILVLDNLGWEYTVRLERLDKEAVSGAIVEKRLRASEPKVALTLFQSLLARDKFEWVLQKGTELGVSRFVPLLTQRGLVRTKQRVKPEKRERWQRILTEAAEQSGRTRVPLLAEVTGLPSALEDAVTLDLSLVASPVCTSGTLRQTLDEARPRDPASVGLFIGPEGGFAPIEVERCTASGARAVRLGPRVLRTETAAVIGVALVLHELGDMD